jgi:hypothetical protein
MIKKKIEKKIKVSKKKYKNEQEWFNIRGVI